jgi:hypothetical protein
MAALQPAERTSHLGWHSSYFMQVGSQFELANSFEHAYKRFNTVPTLDEVAVLEVLNNNYMFGDRTILCGLKKSPWMSYLNSSKTAWVQHQLPEHGQRIEDPEQIGEQLFSLLCQEIKSYVGDKTCIGILLSGGMDSRIVAGVLQYLVSHGELKLDRVVAYTWGSEDSRDVVYSRRIAELFNWEWRHFVVSPEDLWETFVIAGHRGCEFSGFHLHAIPQIVASLDVEVMLAGSYGDSIGRAEYSGKHVTRLSPIDAQMKNPAYLMKSVSFARAKRQYFSDVGCYHDLFPRTEPYARYELDNQLHYMRRMLNPCISLISERIETYQAFTHPSVFGFMWSLMPRCRNNIPYSYILKKIGAGLDEVPWARTGLKYLERTGNPDNLNKVHHRYSEFMQSDLIDRVQDRLLSHRALRDTVINIHAVKRLIRLVRSHEDQNFDYLEKLGWLVSFTYFLDKYEVFRTSNRMRYSDWIHGNINLPLQYLLVRTARTTKRRLRR